MIKREPMLFRRLYILNLFLLCFAGCASKSQSPLSGNISFYDPAKKAEFERGLTQNHIQRKFGLVSTDSLFAKEDESGFLLLQPDSQTWKAYYYFFHLRKRIFEDFPHIIPENENEIPVVFNSRVQYFLQYFQSTGRSSFSKWLSRSGKYIPMMKQILEAKGMPVDLVYLAMIESGFNVRAKSHMGAVGPWQFISSTAKRYGLRVDSWVDERMDPEKSTIAAANYLRDLYNMFQSWELAAAGYNCGEERVQAAIDRFQVYDFWEISEHTLPRETKDYVPKLMAALIIAKNPEKYGFRGIEYQEPRPVENVLVLPQRSLRDIARVIGIDYMSLRDFNPSLIREATPPGISYKINVPMGYGKIVTARYNEISALKMAAVSTPSKTNYHRVRRGESLGKIAVRYGISINSIKKANRIRGSTIRVGQVLAIPGGSRVAYSNTNATVRKGGTVKHKVRRGDSLGRIAVSYGSSVSAIKSANGIKSSQIVAGQVLTIPAGNSVSRDNSKAADVIKYRVKKGDTLWDIASKYDVSVSSIKRWNNLRSSQLASGKQLTIYVE
jgi:membrane-bound lytic murein transglycosylase D